MGVSSDDLLGLGLAKLHLLAIRTAHLRHEEDQHAKDEKQRQKRRKERRDPTRGGDILVVLGFRVSRHELLQHVITGIGRLEARELAGFLGCGVLVISAVERRGCGMVGDLVHTTLVDRRDKVARDELVNLLLRAKVQKLASHKGDEHEPQEHV